MTTGERIKNRRLALGLTLEKVGNAVGVHKSTVKRWEDGDTQGIGMDKLIAICNVLLVRPEYLIGLSDDPGELAKNAMQIAASDLTPEETNEVINFIGYIKTRRKNK